VTTPRDEVRQDQEEVRRRQKARATVMAVLLGALVILIFAISIAKIRAGIPK
jgi:hypothetical protein